MWLTTATHGLAYPSASATGTRSTDASRNKGQAKAGNTGSVFGAIPESASHGLADNHPALHNISIKMDPDNTAAHPKQRSVGDQQVL
ncbi:hypothetical protein XFUD_09280 [Xylella fastidiosa]|nr:hypothetical protein XFUD_09280 [Xylella fastidiosa]ARO68350.1 hypothetical protein B9J09_04185 [Xylella fastidiosa subsp. pauca]ETE33514.1 hypothetical protein B398_04415 [Xylella fastidiosa 32]OCA57510.1 hypothetical protein AA93_09100 [Xylella fastidiosa subsp. pauca 11399]ALR02570.1 hypothetical protein OY18_10595 [Xylella fastidiosa]